MAKLKISLKTEKDIFADTLFLLDAKWCLGRASVCPTRYLQTIHLTFADAFEWLFSAKVRRISRLKNRQ